METIANVKLADIYVDFDQNARITYDKFKLEELASSIKKDGLSHPLTIRKTVENDKTELPFVLVAGYRRYKAMSELLKWDETPSANITEQQGAEAAIFSFNENLAREDITTYEKARGLVMIRDQFKVGPKEISKRLSGNVSTENSNAEMKKPGFKPQTIGNLMRIWDKLSDDIKEEWRKGHPRATTLTLLGIIREEDHTAQWDKWLDVTGQKVEESAGDDDDDNDDDDDDDSDDKASGPARPNVHKLHDAIAAIKESSHAKEWIEGAVIALEYAAGIRKRIPGVSLVKKEKPKAKKTAKAE